MKKMVKHSEIHIGDKVRILDGSKIPHYAGMWISDMEKYVDKIGTIDGIQKDSVTINESLYRFDLRGIEKVGNDFKDFKRGMMAKVLYVDEDHDLWKVGMSATRGKVYRISTVDPADETVLLENGYWYPYTCLELVKDESYQPKHAKKNKPLPQPKFKIGDEVKILNGEMIEGANLDWFDDMYLRGVCTITAVSQVRNGGRFVGYDYNIDRSAYYYDEKWLEKVDAEEEKRFDRFHQQIVIKVDEKDPMKVVATHIPSGRSAFARCNPSDEFNFSIGASLAFMRLIGGEGK
jgi:hypothetical protein